MLMSVNLIWKGSYDKVRFYRLFERLVILWGFEVCMDGFR